MTTRYRMVRTPRRGWHLLLAGLALALLWVAAQAAQAGQTAPASERPAILLDVRGPIGPATTEYLAAGLAHAEERNAHVIILRLDTPGGLVSSLRDINRAILASPVPIISYVAPGGAQAASAGTYMVYASHLAAMAPGTNLGAATPVTMGGAPNGDQDDDPPARPSSRPAGDDDAAPGQPGGTGKAPTPGTGSAPAGAAGQKAVNDAVAYIRSLAELRGRNADWAEAAVREAASLPASQALAQGVVEIVAPDLPDLLRQADGREVQAGGQTITLATQGLAVETFSANWRHRLLSIITHPNLAYLLLLVGIYGIIFELMNPGALLPGTIGGISLLTALLALNMLPVNAAGIGLLLLGIGLMTAEAFVASFGILGLAGITAFVLGSVLLFDSAIPGLELDWPVVAFAAVASLAVLAAGLAAVVRAHRRPPVMGQFTPVGEHGVVLQWQGEAGTVQVHGETWQARGPAGLALGQAVRVASREGLVLGVEADPGTPRPIPADPG